MEIQDTLVQLASQLVELKLQKGKLEAEVETIKGKIKVLGDEFIQYSKNHDISGIKVNGMLVSFMTTPRTSIENTEAAFEYFRSINMGHLIKESIHYQTLNTTVKDLIENDQLDPEEAPAMGLKIYDQEVVRIARTK